MGTSNLIKQVFEALAKGDYTAAKHHADVVYRKMSVIEGNMTVAYAYFLAGDLTKASTLAQEALTALLAQRVQHPEHLARYLWFMAGIQIAEADYAGALENLNLALQYNPQEMGIYGNLAEVLLHQKSSLDQALQAINTQIDLNQQKPPGQQVPLITAYLLKAWVLILLKDEKAADVLIHEAFEKLNPDKVPLIAQVNYLAAQTALARQDAAGVRVYIQRVLAVDPHGLYAQLARKLLDKLE